MNSPRSHLSRRGLLRASAAAVAAGAAGTVLAGCGGSSVQAKPLGTHELKLPAKRPAPKIPGGKPGTVPGSPTVMDHYPAEPFRSVAEKPGSGGEVSFFELVWGAPPSGDRNPWLKEFGRRLNIKPKLLLVPSDSFGDKTQTTLAAGDLPDIFYINNDVSMAPAVFRSIAQGAFTDLTEHLGGDAVLDYPNLAMYESYTWRNSSVQGGIYGVPRGTPRINKVRFHRADWRKHLDMDLPKNADELFKMLKGFAGKDMPNRGKGNTWAMVDWCDDVFWSVFHVPNQWQVNDDGSMDRFIETDAYEEALALQSRLWKAGAYHPSTPTMSVTQQGDLFNQGRVGLYGQGIMSVVSPEGLIDTLTKQFKKAEFTGLIPPGHDGGDPKIHQSPGYFGFFGIPSKTGKDKERTRELLRILNYIAAPFGSEEYLFMAYGIKGKNYIVKDEQILPHPKPDASSVMISYLNQPENAVAYIPGAADRALQVQKLIEKATPISIADPTLGLFSDTAISRTALLDQMVTDHKIGVITGRQSLRSLKGLRKTWRKQGGDRMREEFEKAVSEVR